MSKSAKELGEILTDMYNNAPRKRQVTMVHLFAIKYSEDIKRVGSKEVVEASELSIQYQAEINKGVNLAEYVVPK